MFCVGVIFVVGVPIYWLWVLFSNKDDMLRGSTLRAAQYSFLVSSYKPRYFYWECAEMLRKVTLTGIVSLVEPGSVLQVAVTGFISLSFLTLHCRCYPFKSTNGGDDANLLKLGTEVVLMIVYNCVIMLRVLELEKIIDGYRVSLTGTTTGR